MLFSLATTKDDWVVKAWELVREGEDKLSWKENKCGKFSVRSPYASLARGGREPFLAIIVWNPWVQTEILVYLPAFYLGKDLAIARGYEEYFKTAGCRRQILCWKCHSSTAIPTSGTKLRDRLVKIITDYRTETSLRHGCNDILKADCVNLLVKYYKEARHAIYLSNEEDEARAKRGDSRASQATERPLSMKTMEVKSKTRGGGRCCMCFDPFSIQNVSVIAFFCCHAYHMNCLMDSTYSVSGKQGKGATSRKQHQIMMSMITVLMVRMMPHRVPLGCVVSCVLLLPVEYRFFGGVRVCVCF
ncbi:Vacuolar protein sorting-associated protein 41-like [Vitis vinifera]|uniref:Vacuolar protein sorting-associated protein 41-like n=1 Tax=Vitis vinifera TaxID=29760 RepID=A0A438KFE2_VITVI|nr:Vacuolar protein sorting-associated protein 41-like [Vitis vinifera]